MLEPASILTLESFRRLLPIVHKGNPGLYISPNGERPSEWSIRKTELEK